MTMAKNSRCNFSRLTGATLIGAIISIMILSTGMAALFSLYIDSRKNSAHSQHAATALAYGREKIETLRFLSNSIIPATGSEHFQQQHINYQRSWQIRENPGDNYQTVQILIQWLDSSGDHVLTLNTLIAMQPAGDFIVDTIDN